MRNFEEKMILRSRNLRRCRRLPLRVIRRLARHFDKGGFIPLFINPADNYAIEAVVAQYRLARTNRRKYKRNNNLR